MTSFIVAFDRKIIAWLRSYHQLIARTALFTVFAWFGFLKIINESPANGLAGELLQKTIPSMSLSTFMVLFGVYEMVIGILFLIPKAERVAIAFLIPHMLMTAAVFVLTPDAAWERFLVPTMEGQYVIKNMVIIALAFTIAADLHPLKLDKRR